MNHSNVPQETIVAFEALKAYLLNHFPDARKAAGGKEIVKRCHYCGDSKDVNSRHLYIGIDKYNNISCHCFKCSAGGVITNNFFRELNIFDVELMNLVNKANSSAMQRGYTGGSVKRISKVYTTPVLPRSNDDRTLKKLSYVNKRLGLALTIDDLARLNIIPNIKEYVDTNGIGYYTRHPDIISELDLGFMGFLSVDKTHVCLRRLVPKDKVHPNISERYVNYKVYPNIDGVNFYFVPGSINTLLPVRICIAEGAFDILSVAMNLSHPSNTLFAAACGKGNYGSLIEYIYIQCGIPLFTSELHVYSDSDIHKYDVNNLKNLVKAIGVTAYIHYNDYSGEKDFGVARDHISDVYTRL